MALDKSIHEILWAFPVFKPAKVKVIKAKSKKMLEVLACEIVKYS